MLLMLGNVFHGSDLNSQAVEEEIGTIVDLDPISHRSWCRNIMGVWVSCDGRFLDDYTYSFITFPTLCKFLDAQCRDSPLGINWQFVHVGACDMFTSVIHKPIDKSEWIIKRHDDFLALLETEFLSRSLPSPISLPIAGVKGRNYFHGVPGGRVRLASTSTGVQIAAAKQLSNMAFADLKFPAGFKFGAATSCYQIEGGWNASDKGESVWDKWVRQIPSPVQDGSTGDVACDSYHRWQRDIQIAHELGLDFYRFSISWPRILPKGFSNVLSKDGIAYYNKLIDGLLERGIEPVVTMYHFDLPQNLQDLGGWANPLIADWFSDYARVLFSQFADRVRMWITINEPIMVCDYIYNTGQIAPAVKEPITAPFICNKNLLLAHARAWRIYDEEYKHKYHGKISIAINPFWIEPATNEDEELAILAREYGEGRYAHPIYSKTGGWPECIERLVEENSKRLGYPRSNLPRFTDEEITFIRGTYDFYSLNHYTSKIIRPARAGEEPGFWPIKGLPIINGVLENAPQSTHSPLQNLAVQPEGIRRQIAWTRKQYGNLTILISENGYPTTSDSLNDTERIDFIRKYLEQILSAISKDGADVIGYTVWSMIDNFEWYYGYRLKYGLYQVDFSSPNRSRTARLSARFYSELTKHRSLGAWSNSF